MRYSCPFDYNICRLRRVEAERRIVEDVWPVQRQKELAAISLPVAPRIAVTSHFGENTAELMTSGNFNCTKTLE